MTIEKEMTIEEKRKPALDKSVFECPHCNDPASYSWQKVASDYTIERREKEDNYLGKAVDELTNLKTAECNECRKVLVWVDKKMIYPVVSPAPKPDLAMPPKVKEIYEEARLVSIHSSRAAAALLRVSLEELTKYLDAPEVCLYEQIRELYQRDFPEELIQMFDIVRVTANKNGAHSGEIDMTGADGVVVANTLFWLVNHIVEIAITLPNKRKQEYAKIPQNNRDEIAKRDKPKDKT